jgi:hypothetical protein
MLDPSSRNRKFESVSLHRRVCREPDCRRPDVYDLRKLKGHGLLQRDGSRYAYRLTPKGVQVALLFLFFHKRNRADKAIQQIVDLLAA